MKEAMSLSQCLPRPHHLRSINKIMLLPKLHFSGSAPSKTAGTISSFFFFFSFLTWPTVSRRPQGMLPVFLTSPLGHHIWGSPPPLLPTVVISIEGSYRLLSQSPRSDMKGILANVMPLALALLPILPQRVSNYCSSAWHQYS